MTMISIKVNTNALEHTVETLQHRLSHMRPVMAGISLLMLEVVEDAFANERDPVTGAPWQPLKPATQQQRARHGHAGKILQVTGSLAASVQAEAGDDYALVGTNKSYAAVHQFGFSGTQSVSAHSRQVSKVFGKRLAKAVHQAVKAHSRQQNIPARPFLGMSQSDEQRIKDKVQNYLLHGESR